MRYFAVICLKVNSLNLVSNAYQRTTAGDAQLEFRVVADPRLSKTVTSLVGGILPTI